METFYKLPLKIFYAILLISLSNTCYSQVTEDWTHRYTGPEASTDTPSEFVIDDVGNYYLTGQSALSGGYGDIVTVKFNSSGVRQWISKYNGPADQHDNGTAIQVDDQGNVYVIGSSSAPLQNLNIVVIKYSSSGTQQWVQHYNGPANFVDVGIDISLDAVGNIYAGGYSNGTGTAFDFVLIKYNSSGTHQWTRRWNGISNSDDYLYGIEPASNGDIIVAGTSYNSSTNFDYTVLRYNSSGDTVWTKKYNGTASMDDHITDLKLDLQNNIYVCGKSPGTGTNYDYALVKFNSAGTQQWAARYNGLTSNDDSPSSMDIDKSGNIYVTGYSNNGNISYFDYATVKYNSEGVQQWISIYNGTESYYDYGIDLKTDDNGNIFVTGQCLRASDGTNDIVTIKYNSGTGNKIWDKTYNGPGNLDDDPVQMEIDNSGKLLVIANSYSYFFSILCGASDYLALKYDSDGNVEYETRFDGSGQGIDEAASMFTDNNGNCYVTGVSFDNVTDLDYATLKYNSEGAPLWAMRYDGGNGIDKASSVAADNSGNVYVTGISKGALNDDIVTVKYNSEGIQQWERRYNGAANGNDLASGLVLDGSGNSYITGSSDGAGSGKDFVTIKYSPAGIQQWASRYNGTGNSNDYANSIIVDASGNSYVTGKSTGLASLQDIVTVKYNSAGSQQWAAVYNSSANDSDEASCIALDLSGNIIVGGRSKNSSGNFDFITLKYNSSGALQWTQTHNGSSSNSADEITSITSDNKGNIIAGGNVQNLNSGYDLVTLKYNPSGNQLWVSNHNGTSNSDDRLSSVCLDQAGNVYAAGFSNDIGTGLNFLTIKYNTDGKSVWSKDYNYIDNDTDKATNVRVDISGNVFVTGVSKSIESKKDFFTVKYSQGKSVFLKAIIEGFYNEAANTMISDSAKLFLRNASAPYALADSSVSVLNSSGTGNFIFSNAQDNAGYFIVINHRNSIETWSSGSHSFQSNSINYNFTSAASQAYGNNLKQKGNMHCVFSGDAVKDGIVDLTDLVFIYNASSVFTAGYHAADVNGDEIIDLTDLIITYNNSSVFVSVIRP